MKYKNIGIMVWSLNAGGAERAAANLSKDLCEVYNTFVFLFDANNIVYPYGGTIVDIGAEVKNGIFTKGIELLSRCKRIRKLKKQYKIDVMISYMPNANFYNVITAGKTKTIISIRNHMSKKLNSTIERKMITWCGKRSDMTVSLSEGVRRDLINNFKYIESKVVTIYNSCSLSWLMKQSENTNNNASEQKANKTITTVGRLTYQKGQWHLIRAMKKVCEKIPDAKLLIFGEGELYEDLINLTRQLNIEDNVVFKGFVKNHHNIMKECDVFVFPSLFEGLGNVLLEALACGMPIISTDCESGPREILNDEEYSNAIDEVEYCKYGILIPPFSMGSLNLQDTTFEKSDYLLADTIIELLNSDKMKSHYRAQSLLRANHFLPEEIKKQWINVIENI